MAADSGVLGGIELLDSLAAGALSPIPEGEEETDTGPAA